MRKLPRVGWRGELARVSIGLGVVAASLATPPALPVRWAMAEDPSPTVDRGIPQELKPELKLLGRLVSRDGTLMLRVRATMPGNVTKDVFLAIPADEGRAPERANAAADDESQVLSARISTVEADYTLEILRFSTRLPLQVKVECTRDVLKSVAARPDAPKPENETKEFKKDRITNVSEYLLDW
jgi:hypothetical protein